MTQYDNNLPLTTALPSLPEKAELLQNIDKLLESRVLTNRGFYNLAFEQSIARYLDIPEASIVSCANGTLALELCMRAMELKGKVIVTPFTFVASVHAVMNVGLEPVFVDIDPKTLCLKPEAVEKALDADVSAVMPVNVYGNICDLDYFEGLRQKGIKVIYDSAHAFGTKYEDRYMATHGDAEIFSFHATKIMNACEGGAVTSNNHELIHKIKLMTNFGFTGETNVELVGTNAKLSEIHSIVGSHSLKYLPNDIEARRQVVNCYQERLQNIDSLQLLHFRKEIQQNYQYFPIFFAKQEIRDTVYNKLQEQKIFARKYFYPLVCDFKPYQEKFSVEVPNAKQAAETVLCLPIHGSMLVKDAEFVVEQLGHYL